MAMLDATERARPILAYVHDLETKVRQYRSQERRFQLKWFFLGVLAGAATISVLSLLHLFQ